jgi:hypothetical protein
MSLHNVYSLVGEGHPPFVLTQMIREGMCGGWHLKTSHKILGNKVLFTVIIKNESGQLIFNLAIMSEK